MDLYEFRELTADLPGSTPILVIGHDDEIKPAAILSVTAEEIVIDTEAE